jgi:hypothetical protein
MVTKPFRPDHHNPVLSKDGVTHITRCRCPDCLVRKKEQARQYYHAKHEENRIKKRAYVEKNREHVDTYQRQYREANKDKLKEHDKQYREEHKEEINAQRLEYRQNNRDLLNERQKEYYQEHREERLAYAKVFRDERQAPYYKMWESIKQRCFNSNSPQYKYWGGNDIGMYDSWKERYSVFEEYIETQLGPKTSPDQSIDRIDVYGDYVPGNLRWASPLQQQQNKRKTIINKTMIPDDSVLKYNDQFITLKEFSEVTGLHLIAAKYRYSFLEDVDFILNWQYDGRNHPWNGHLYTLTELHLILGIEYKILHELIKMKCQTVDQVIEQYRLNK